MGTLLHMQAIHSYTKNKDFKESYTKMGDKQEGRKEGGQGEREYEYIAVGRVISMDWSGHERFIITLDQGSDILLALLSNEDCLLWKWIKGQDGAQVGTRYTKWNWWRKTLKSTIINKNEAWKVLF